MKDKHPRKVANVRGGLYKWPTYIIVYSWKNGSLLPFDEMDQELFYFKWKVKWVDSEITGFGFFIRFAFYFRSMILR